MPHKDFVEEKTPEDVSYVPLSDLAKKNTEKQEISASPVSKAGVDSGNKSALKSALADILTEQKKSVSNEIHKEPHPPHENKTVVLPPQNATPPLSQDKSVSKEVPEDVLRKVLE